MALPFVLMAAGTALQVFGQYQANQAQAKAELQNAAFYKDQADFAFASGIRQAELARRSYTFDRGAKTGAYARGGVDLSGSAAITISESVSQMYGELSAIKNKQEIETKLALMRSRNASDAAATLQDPLYNLTQAGGTALTNIAKSSDSWVSAGTTAASTQSSYHPGSGGGSSSAPSGGGYLGDHTFKY
jgi:hypothetical protein